MEGFASLIGEARINPRLKIFDPIHGANNSTDVVANATKDQVIRWTNLLRYGRRHFGMLSTDPHPQFEVLTTQVLGARFNLSPTGLFYQQSTAVARYLYAADDGAHRQKLLQYLADYEGGKDPEHMHFQDTFGMTMKKAGQKAKAFAEKLAAEQ